jgi:hypothetical protein
MRLNPLSEPESREKILLRKLKGLGIVLVALGSAQLLSGCYMVRGLDWSKDKVDSGEKTKATLELGGLRADFISPNRFFVVLPEPTEMRFKGGRFDTSKVFGQPQKLRRDDDLALVVATRSDCSAGLGPFVRQGPPPEPYAVYRTNKIQPETTKLLEATLTYKATGNNQAGGIFGTFVTGGWVDDGDGVPEDPEGGEDQVECIGGTSTTVEKKGESEMSAQRSVLEAMLAD